MSDKPMTANTQDLANTEYDAERWTRVGGERQSSSPASSKAPPDPTDRPEVGLSQEGADEAATVKRETEI